MREKFMKYQGDVAVVTGAGSGIGRALTHALTQQGTRIAASDIDQRGLDETRAACRRGHVSTCRVDVADRDTVLNFAEDVRHQPWSASMVFNDAGVDLFAGVADMSWTDFDWLMGINVGGVVAGPKPFCRNSSSQAPPAVPPDCSTFPVPSVSSRFPIRAQPACRSCRARPHRGITAGDDHGRTSPHRALRAPGRRAHQLRGQYAHSGHGGSRPPPKLFDRAALTSATKAARLILRGADKNRARILIGADGRAMAAIPASARRRIHRPLGPRRRTDGLPLEPLASRSVTLEPAAGASPPHMHHHLGVHAHIIYCNNYSTILRRDRPFTLNMPEDQWRPSDDQRYGRCRCRRSDRQPA